MIEIRRLRVPYTTTSEDRLQFRVHLPVVDIGGHLCPGEWTDWQDVPVVIDELVPLDAAGSAEGVGGG